MTHEEFNKLYRSGAITIVEFYGEYDGDTKAVEAFEWNGKFYLRLHSVHPYTITRSEEVIADFLTRAEAKSIIRHYCKVGLQNNWEEMYVEVLYDGAWENCTCAWAYTELVEQEDWFDRKGLDYNWWLQFGEIRRI